LDVTENIVLVTLDSLDRLDLLAGTPVIATVKATATRATPIGDGA
jgi:molybdopterin-binding protein